MRIEWLVWRSCVHAVAAVSQRGARTEPDWLIALALRTLPRACRVDRKHVTERQPLTRARSSSPPSLACARLGGLRSGDMGAREMR